MESVEAQDPVATSDHLDAAGAYFQGLPATIVNRERVAQPYALLWMTDLGEFGPAYKILGPVDVYPGGVSDAGWAKVLLEPRDVEVTLRFPKGFGAEYRLDPLFVENGELEWDGGFLKKATVTLPSLESGEMVEGYFQGNLHEVGKHAASITASWGSWPVGQTAESVCFFEVVAN